MTVQARLKYSLVAALALLSLGGMAVHGYVHPLGQASYALLPLAVGFIGVAVTPWLFLRKSTLHLGYLLNGFSAVIGTVAMGHYSLAVAPVFPDILILWAKFLTGYALFHLESFPATANYSPGLKSIRYPHFGFWIVHLLALSTVYSLGHALWTAP